MVRFGSPDRMEAASVVRIGPVELVQLPIRPRIGRRSIHLSFPGWVFDCEHFNISGLSDLKQFAQQRRFKSAVFLILEEAWQMIEAKCGGLNVYSIALALERKNAVIRILMAMALVMLASAAALQAAGRRSDQPTDPRNAATWYQRAIDHMQRLDRTSMDAIFNFNWPQRPTPELRSQLAKLRPALDLLHRGSLQQYGDFGLDYSEGFALMMPHLGQMRDLARAARFDAAMLVHDGDTAGAARRFADLYRTSGHLADGHIIIAGLVGQAIFAFADAGVQEMIDKGALNAADSATLLSALNRLNSRDPFGYLEAIVGEQEIFVNQMLEQFADLEQRAEMLGMLEVNGEPDARAHALMLLDEDQVAQEVAKYDALMDRVVEVFAMPDRDAAKAALDKIEGELENGEHGLLVVFFLPAYGKVFERREIAEKMLRDRVAVLQKLAAGEVQPDEIANAAMWYMRAIEMLQQVTPERMKLMREFAADPSGEVTTELAAMLGEAQSIIDVLRDGSQKKRCDFAFARGDWQFKLAQSYATGMHDLLRLLQDDAVRLLKADDPATKPAAVDRLAIALRVIGHLGGDSQVVSVLSAHHHFNSVMEIITAALARNLIEQDARSVLADAADRIGRSDPFSYIAAVAEMRQSAARALGGAYIRSQQDHDRRERAQKMVSAWDLDQLLFAMAVLHESAATQKIKIETARQSNEATEPAATDINAAKPAHPLAPLSDILAISGLEAAQVKAAELRMNLNEPDLDRWVGFEAVPISDLRKKMAGARADLRQVQRVLRKPPEEQAKSPAPLPSYSDTNPD